MKPSASGIASNKRIILHYASINIVISSILVIIMWYADKFIEGILFYVSLVLFIPIFLIIAVLTGPNNAMHFTKDSTYYLVSFVFYSLVIALVQFFLYKREKKVKEI